MAVDTSTACLEISSRVASVASEHAPETSGEKYPKEEHRSRRQYPNWQSLAPFHRTTPAYQIRAAIDTHPRTPLLFRQGQKKLSDWPNRENAIVLRTVPTNKSMRSVEPVQPCVLKASRRSHRKAGRTTCFDTPPTTATKILSNQTVPFFPRTIELASSHHLEEFN